MNKDSLWWNAPEYFSRWRLFPRAFISMYIYLLWDVTTWFMALPDPNTQQAGLVSVLVGSGAAWFGLYVNSSSTKFVNTVPVTKTMSTNDPEPEVKSRYDDDNKTEIKSRY
tara:strand:- start:4718 stop:5050 length:333 start_codon:yes stop_codon:yes gene_type:complete